VRATVNGSRLAAGGPNLLAELNVTPDTERAAARGQGAICLVENGRALAVFAVADAVRRESAEAVRRLHAKGVEVVMLTGDARAVADAVARELGIDAVFVAINAQLLRRVELS
jgi:Cu2+-exporting ATPase